MTSQNIDISSWDTLYIELDTIYVFLNLFYLIKAAAFFNKINVKYVAIFPVPIIFW